MNFPSLNNLSLLSKIMLTAPTIIFTLFLSSCSSPISYDIRFDNVEYDVNNRRTVISAINSLDSFKIKELRGAIMELGPDIDPNEANFVAREAVLFPMVLANQYRLVSPPNSQNVLVNTGKRERGLCYHWAKDMMDHIVEGRVYNTLTLQRAVANQGKNFEHNVLTVAAKGKGIEDAYILDAWRHSAKLYWVKTADDPDYDWKKYYPRLNKVSPVATISNQLQ